MRWLAASLELFRGQIHRASLWANMISNVRSDPVFQIDISTSRHRAQQRQVSKYTIFWVFIILAFGRFQIATFVWKVWSTGSQAEQKAFTFSLDQLASGTQNKLSWSLPSSTVQMIRTTGPVRCSTWVHSDCRCQTSRSRSGDKRVITTSWGCRRRPSLKTSSGPTSSSASAFIRMSILIQRRQKSSGGLLHRDHENVLWVNTSGGTGKSLGFHIKFALNKEMYLFWPTLMEICKVSLG